MYNHINPKNGQKAPLIADDVYAIIMEVGHVLPYWQSSGASFLLSVTSQTQLTCTRGDAPHGNMLNAVGLSFAACSAAGQ